MTKAKLRQDDISQTIKELTAKLNVARKEAVQHSNTLQSLYSELVKNVFGQNYNGIIFNNKKEYDFQILNNGELSGAVTETLSIILGDMAAMLSACLGLSYHPGFHIHDSPREADLSPVLYQWLFKVFSDIALQLGGPEDAPFQHIITTTTPPPEELSSYVRLELAAKPPSDYLFRECLHSERTLFSEVMDHPDNSSETIL